MRRPTIAVLPVLLIATLAVWNSPSPALADHLDDAVASSARPASDTARDADRKPAEILRFYGIAPGMNVAELMSGRGYYAEILAAAVGESGKVYVQNNQFVLERFAEKDITERLAKPQLKNAVRLDREIDDPGLPAGELDAALMILFYHDTYWMEADREKMNRAVFEALKPGGTYGIVDHHAEPGSGPRDVKTLHRVDAALVKKEVLAAGFEWVGESDVLAHPEDDRSANVFDDGLRGKTDRFAYRFRKPR